MNTPFPLLDQKRDRLFLILFVFVFSILFLNIFEPFNIGRWFSDSGIIRFLRLSSYGFVVALVYLFTQFPLRKWCKTGNFSIKSYLLWLTLEILLISLVYIFLYGNPVGNFINDFVFSLKYTLLGICLPYAFAILLIHYKNHRTEIQNLKKQIPQSGETRFVAFRDENGKIRFSLHADDLLLMESTDNYVSVFYLNKGKVQRKLLRNSLKNLEKEFRNKTILRCHRSFMVNTKNMEFIQRDGKKMVIQIKNMEKPIPVSEKYSSLFIDFLS